MTTKHTPGPWWFDDGFIASGNGETYVTVADPHCNEQDIDEREANARLIAAAPTQHAEMLRYLPVLERVEADSELWARLTDGLGIATLNGYRAAIAKAEGQ